MDSTQHSFQECPDELHPKEGRLNSVQVTATESNNHLESVRVSLEQRIQQLDGKERELIIGFRDELVKEFDSREQRLVWMGKSVEERVKEVELREAKVKVVFEEFKADENRFEEIQESIGRRINEQMEELDDKEREFNVFRDEQVNELDLRDKQLGERIKQVELREYKVKVILEKYKVKEKRFEDIRHLVEEKIDLIGRRVKELDAKEKDFGRRVKELDAREEDFERRVKELDAKEEDFERRVKELDANEEDCERRVKELDANEEDFERRVKELDAKDEDFERRVKELDANEEDFERRVKELDAKEDGYKRRVKELDAKEEDFVRRVKKLDANKEDFERRVKELDANEENFERRVKEVIAKEEDFEKRMKELEYNDKEPSDLREIESMGKEISNVDPTNVKIEFELEDNPANSSTGIQFFAKMDGKGLQSFLNQREKDHHLMAEEVYRGLQLSSDPAKLVLDAMEGFYCHPDHGNREFQLNVTRKSCILLLEQLQRISPKVSPQVRAEAMELVWQWKVKLQPIPDSMEVLGHLYLSASYRLPILFDAAELLGLFGIVAEHRQAPELCRILGFTDRVQDLIRILVRKNHVPVAVRFVYEFGLVDEFSPALLLKDYVKQLRKVTRKMLKNNDSCTSQDAVIDKRVAALQEVIRCIIDHKLESMYSPKCIEDSIEHLLRLKGDNKGTAPPPSSKPVEPEKCRKQSMSSINSLTVSNPSSTAPRSSKPVVTKLVPLTDMAFILANMDGERLQFFLNGHFEDHELMRDVMFLAIQHSSDPGRLVLDAMQGFHLPYGKVGDEHFEVSVRRSSCILLLEQLMRLQIHLQPQMKGEAMVVAHHWELTMRDEIENPQVILGFFQFIGAFGLTSCFESDDLHCLFEKIAPHPHARELCQLLGFAEKNPGCVLHPRVISEGSSLENVPLDKAVDFVNVSPKRDSNSLGVKMEGKNEVPIFRCVSDPAKLVLDAIQGGYHSILEKGSNCPKAKMMDAFSSLLKQLTRASPQIKSQVQEQATAFSIDWKSNLLVSRMNLAEVKAFMHLLASYKLASSVMFEVLHGLLETVPDYEKKFKLYRHLNFAHMTPDYIQYLIDNDERLLAIRFIYEFKLVEKFPPVPILKSHLHYIEMHCTKICTEGNNSPKALDKAANKEVELLRAVIKCLTIHSIECDWKPENLQVRIDEIMKQKDDRKFKKPGLKKRLEGHIQEQDATKRPRLTTPPITPHLTWQYGYGGPPLGWQYIPTTPYIYRPWQ